MRPARTAARCRPAQRPGPGNRDYAAEDLAESSGATSYHLRQLARHRFIGEFASGKGREHWWRPIRGGWGLMDALRRWPDQPAQWRDAMVQTTSRFQLTAEEAVSLRTNSTRCWELLSTEPSKAEPTVP